MKVPSMGDSITEVSFLSLFVSLFPSGYKRESLLESGKSLNHVFYLLVSTLLGNDCGVDSGYWSGGKRRRCLGSGRNR
jgi:hypothetical protein